MAEHWNRLPRAVVTSLSLSEFKKRVDNAFGHRVKFLVSVQGQELNSMILMGSSQVPVFQDFMRHTLGSASPDSNVLLQQGKIQGSIFHSSVLAEAHFFLVLPEILVRNPPDVPTGQKGWCSFPQVYRTTCKHMTVSQQGRFSH